LATIEGNQAKEDYDERESLYQRKRREAYILLSKGEKKSKTKKRTERRKCCDSDLPRLFLGVIERGESGRGERKEIAVCRCSPLSDTREKRRTRREGKKDEGLLHLPLICDTTKERKGCKIVEGEKREGVGTPLQLSFVQGRVGGRGRVMKKREKKKKGEDGPDR